MLLLMELFPSSIIFRLHNVPLSCSSCFHLILPCSILFYLLYNLILASGFWYARKAYISILDLHLFYPFFFFFRQQLVYSFLLNCNKYTLYLLRMLYNSNYFASCLTPVLTLVSPKSRTCIPLWTGFTPVFLALS